MGFSIEKREYKPGGARISEWHKPPGQRHGYMPECSRGHIARAAGNIIAN